MSAVYRARQRDYFWLIFGRAEFAGPFNFKVEVIKSIEKRLGRIKFHEVFFHIFIMMVRSEIKHTLNLRWAKNRLRLCKISSIIYQL